MLWKSPPPQHYCYRDTKHSNTIWKGEQRQSQLKSVWQHDYSVCVLDKNSAALVCCSTTADNSRTQESWPQSSSFSIPTCLHVSHQEKNAYVEGKKAHMANPAVREVFSNIGWVATVTEQCEKLTSSCQTWAFAFLFLLQKDLLSSQKIWLIRI